MGSSKARADYAKEMRMRRRVVNFIGSDEEVMHLFAEELAAAVKAAILAVRAFLENYDGTSN
jgi:hypothetical protein